MPAPALTIQFGSALHSVYNWPMQHDQLVVAPCLLGSELNVTIYHDIRDELERVMRESQNVASWSFEADTKEGSMVTFPSRELTARSGTVQDVVGRICRYFSIEAGSVGFGLAYRRGEPVGRRYQYRAGTRYVRAVTIAGVRPLAESLSGAICRSRTCAPCSFAFPYFTRRVLSLVKLRRTSRRLGQNITVVAAFGSPCVLSLRRLESAVNDVRRYDCPTNLRLVNNSVVALGEDVLGSHGWEFGFELQGGVQSTRATEAPATAKAFTMILYGRCTTVADRSPILVTDVSSFSSSSSPSPSSTASSPPPLSALPLSWEPPPPRPKRQRSSHNWECGSGAGSDDDGSRSGDRHRPRG
jgi:hypothetical protein